MCTNNNNVRNINFRSYSYLTIFGIFIVEFLLSSILLSYGIFYFNFVQQTILTPRNALWIALAFVASWNIANPWTRSLFEYFDDNKCNHQHLILILTSLLLSLAIILGASLSSPLSQVLFYGVFGGLCTSSILAQIKETTYDDFQAKPLIFHTVKQSSHACSLLFMPQIILYITKTMDIFQTQYIYSAVLLNVIPVALILRKKQTCSGSLTRYKTFQGLMGDEIELPTIRNISDNQYNSDSSSETSLEDKQSQDTFNEARFLDSNEEIASNSQKHHTFDSKDDETLEIDNFYDVIIEEPDNIKPVYPKTLFGIDIMPEIEEEDETDDELNSNTEKTVENGLKRYSRISEKFEELIVTNHTIQSQQIEYGSKSILNDSNTNNCCSPYKNYVWKKRARSISNCFCENFLNPFRRSFRNVYFYPCLFTKVTKLFLSTTFIVTTPYISLSVNYNPLITENEASFLLTVIAFSWAFFLVGLPWIFDFRKTQMKIVYIIGLLISCGGFSLLTKHINHDVLTLSCLLCGFGHGILSFTEDIVFREAIGVRQWKDLEGTLETSTGILILLLCTFLNQFQIEIETILTKSYIFYIFSSLIWIISACFKLILNSCKDSGTYLIQ